MKSRGQVTTIALAAAMLIGGVLFYYEFIQSGEFDRGGDLDKSEEYYWLDFEVKVDQPSSIDPTGNMDLTGKNIIEIDIDKPTAKWSPFGLGEANGSVKFWTTSREYPDVWRDRKALPESGDDRVTDYDESEYNVGDFDSSTWEEVNDLAMGMVKEGDVFYVHVKIITEEGREEAYHIYKIDAKSESLLDDRHIRE